MDTKKSRKSEIGREKREKERERDRETEPALNRNGVVPVLRAFLNAAFKNKALIFRGPRKRKRRPRRLFRRSSEKADAEAANLITLVPLFLLSRVVFVWQAFSKRKPTKGTRSRWRSAGTRWWRHLFQAGIGSGVRETQPRSSAAPESQRRERGLK